MKRYHLLELEDQRWCPKVIRHAIVETLRLSINLFGFYHSVTDLLIQTLQKSGNKTIFDLCSGGGGPWSSLYKKIQRPDQSIHIHLTDINPDIAVLERIHKKTQKSISYCSEPVSALNIPEQLTGFRTLFSSFHHFKPTEAKAILADAVKSRQGIGVFEFTNRHPLAIFMMALSAPLGPVMLTPFMHPFSWSRILLTYLLPIIPLAAAFDGVISCFRTYTTEELKQFITDFEDEGYHWEIGTARGGLSPFPVTYLIGYPVDNAGHQP